LSDCGYGTAAIGKMHFTPQRARYGFGEMLLPDDYYRAMAESGNPLQPMRHGLGQNELYPGMATVPECSTLTAWTAEQSVRFIRDRRDPTVPFFLWASFSKPHPPLDPPEPYASMYRECAIPDPVDSLWSAGDDSPPAVVRQAQSRDYDLMSPTVIAAARAAYFGLVTQIDYSVGRILAALSDVHLLDETMIIFTSDHGEMLGDHRCGGKVLFYEPSARVPLIVRPAPAAQLDLHGLSSDALVTHADITATILAAAGASAPSGATGIDLLAVAERKLLARSHLLGLGGMEGVPITNSGRLPTYLAVTDGRWKYIWYTEGGIRQLFDLQNDPQERRDLASAEPRRCDELEHLIVAELERHGGKWLLDGRLACLPPQNDAERDRRARQRVGFHTERFAADVRH
jgi:arylsulfatase A-like enzyme